MPSTSMYCRSYCKHVARLVFHGFYRYFYVPRTIVCFRSYRVQRLIIDNVISCMALLLIRNIACVAYYLFVCQYAYLVNTYPYVISFERTSNLIQRSYRFELLKSHSADYIAAYVSQRMRF